MEKPRQNPLPVLPPSSIFQDVSNLRTPVRRTPRRADACSQFQSPNHQFFTASKETPLPPSTNSRPSRRPGRSLSRLSNAASRRLKAFEIEQSKSSRKAHDKKEKALRTLAKSLTTWLNFLLGNPGSCGCSVLKDERMDLVGFDFCWRCPKRRKSENSEESGVGRGLGGVAGSFSGLSGSARFGRLKSSLNEICSLEDLEERMRGYVSLRTCEEVFEVMMLVTKSVDEGRLKMKAHCPIVTDFGLKEKAVKTLLSYNPLWLRIGLHIIHGGDSLLPNGDLRLDGDNAFLKLVIEKQFLAHARLAKSHVYNKNVEGLYRPGYYESLGRIILKRFLLLVLILDRAKMESSLPLRYGIDGLDGGSPLLFSIQSGIKSSPQIVSDFLTGDVMHGEGNVLAHLAILSFKISHQQLPLMEYDFSLRDILEDLQDGVHICRAIQLLMQETSILMKLVVPADTPKKTLANCGTAIRFIKKFGVPLEDDDGVTVTADDVASGDKELTISLLWNMFVHLQLPLLIDKATLTEEIRRVKEDLSIRENSTLLEILLRWIQSICHGYNLEIVNLQSLTDGRAIWCLIDFYFRKELHCSCLSEVADMTKSQESIVSAAEYTDAVHNFALSQKLSSLLGDFPEVLQLSDILEQHGVCDGRCVAILLAFFASHLLVKKNLDQLNFHKLLNCNCQSIERRNFCKQRVLIPLKSLPCKEEVDQCGIEEGAMKFKAIQAWWQNMADQSFSQFNKPVNSTVDILSVSPPHDVRERENAANIIQSHYRRSIERRRFLKIVNAVIMLQSVTRVWLIVRNREFSGRSYALDMEKCLSGRSKGSEMSGRHVMFLFDRHCFIRVKSSTLLIQRAIRIWIARKRQNEDITPQMEMSSPMNQESAAIVIQSHSRRLIVRRQFLKILNSVILIQNITRAWLMVRTDKLLGRNFVLEVEKHSRGRGTRFEMTRRYIKFISDRHGFIKTKNSAVLIQQTIRNCIARKHQEEETRSSMVPVNLDHGSIAPHYLAGFSHNTSSNLHKGMSLQVREEIAAKQILFAWRNHYHRNLRHSSATRIQCCLRGWLNRKEYNRQKEASLTIQRNYRHYSSWKSLMQARIINSSALAIQSYARGWIARRSYRRLKSTIVQIQSSCRGCMARRKFLSLQDAAITIQRFTRGQISRKRLSDARILLTSVVRLQKWWRNIMLHRLRAYSARVIQICARELIARRRVSKEMLHVVSLVIRLQKRWKNILFHRKRAKSTIIIQSYARGFIARKIAAKKRHSVVHIQSYWKGYVARKESRDQVQEARRRVQKAAANVDDSRRLINRLRAALSELLNMKSVSSILHICATLDLATRHSEKCCEELVEAGAIDKLLKLIRSMTRSVPDQEVSKHSLSTLRNITRFPRLLDDLVSTSSSTETIFWELLRNKEDAFFIASEILKKMCSTDRGREAIRRSPPLLKRLHALVGELSKRPHLDRNNARAAAARENSERRLKEAVELSSLISR
ncbi:hypothetical protein MLD38_016804 [Melastoma candidum]|uniref:Uncharacterized protein n=1 Tax=Melastoma candidum TaxID=119954 RepID=A0ACB9QSM4_9MYRT|nr:hypothetical protein MLD38_016804 [Melastoma candidum]